MDRVDKLPGKFLPGDKARISNDYPFVIEMRNQDTIVLLIHPEDFVTISYLGVEHTIHKRWLQHIPPLYRIVPDMPPSQEQFSTDECQCEQCKRD
jgi:hypothetical protein